MAGETTITIIGNLTADPELRCTTSGTMVANFTVASTPRTYDKTTGAWTDGDPLFLRCTVWRDMAEHVEASLKKGDRVIVTGRLRQRSFETTDGQKRTVIEMDTDEVGPSLRWASVEVKKATRTGPGAPGQAVPAQEPWGSEPAPAGGFTEPPPF